VPPKVKSGEVVPEALDAESAMTLLLADPLLIRRPLLEAEGRREVGFDPARIQAWLGLGTAADRLVSEDCARSQSCPVPGEP
jgi:hypothetical protein